MTIPYAMQRLVQSQNGHYSYTSLVSRMVCKAGRYV